MSRRNWSLDTGVKIEIPPEKLGDAMRWSRENSKRPWNVISTARTEPNNHKIYIIFEDSNDATLLMMFV